MNDDLFSLNEPAEIEDTAAEIEPTVEETVDEIEEATEAEDAAAEVVEPVSQEQPKMVPLAALQDERDKAKGYREQLDALQRQAAEGERAKAFSAMPDPLDDPGAYVAFIQQSIDSRVTESIAADRFTRARAQAVAEHGEEFVHELAEFADAYATTVDPLIGEKALNAPDPVAYIISVKKRHDAIQAIGTDEEAFIRRRALELGLIPQVTDTVTAEATKPLSKTPLQPKSINNAPSRGQSKDQGGISFFDSLG